MVLEQQLGQLLVPQPGRLGLLRTLVVVRRRPDGTAAEARHHLFVHCEDACLADELWTGVTSVAVSCLPRAHEGEGFA